MDSSAPICPFLSFLHFPDFFGIFPIFSGGLPDFVLFLFLAPFFQHLRETVPKGSVTQSGPPPKKKWETPGLETPQFSFSQIADPPRTNPPKFTKFGLFVSALGKCTANGFCRYSGGGGGSWGPKLAVIFSKDISPGKKGS